MALPKMLTAAEAADILRCGPWQVVKLCRDKELVASKPGRAWLISEDALTDYIAKHLNTTDAA